MKKFTKLAAVFAALVLAWACFVACSNSSSDSGSNGADDSSSGSDSGSNPSSVQALQGLWILENNEGGIYVVNKKYYLVDVEENNYSYTEKEGMDFSVDGNKLITHYEGEEDDVSEFAIKDNELTLTYVEKGNPVTDTYKKINATPTKK